ncbi:MAG: NAD(P)-dependent oxidoreductase [bacterium]
MKMGFVGLGIMGKSMSSNLLKAGFDLTVWNRTPEKTKPLRELGAKVADSLPALAQVTEIVITMVNDTPDVEEVVCGEHGLLHALSPGKIVIDMSTISPEATEEIAQKLASRGCEMLDAPVSGGDAGARQGTLTIMVGGKKAVFEKCRPVFETMGKNITLCGGHGAGQRMKMINQIFCGLHAVALSEAFVLAEKVGLEPELVHWVVASGAAGSWALDNYGPRLLQNDLRPGFKLGMQQKDLRIAFHTAQQFSEDFKGIELAFQLFTKAKEQGLGELGSHGLIQLYRHKKEQQSG